MKKSLISISLIFAFSSNLFAEEIKKDKYASFSSSTSESITSHDKKDNPFKDYSKIKTPKNIEFFIGKEAKNTQQLFFKNPDFFKTSERIQEDIDFENIMIEKFKSNIFTKKNEMKKEDYNKLINSYFIDALKTGRRVLADELLYNSGADINLDYMSSSPKNNPLMALATSLSYDGGDIEYFIKLIHLGADYKTSTNKNRIPLMSLAASVDNYKIVLYLALKGENPMHLDGFDYYPLDYAVRNDSNKTVIVLTNIISEYKKQIDKTKQVK